MLVFNLMLFLVTAAIGAANSAIPSYCSSQTIRLYAQDAMFFPRMVASV